MMNFCDYVLKPAIHCSSLCTDSYEISNLISKDEGERQRGFMAYNTIKPPVFVTIDFICSVKISHIVIKSQVGSHKCSTLELHTKYMKGTNQFMICDYRKIGYARMESDEIGVIFHQHKNANIMTYPVTYKKQVFQYDPWSDLLQNATSLQIKIVYTGSSVPCLAKVEVWGLPGSNCSPDMLGNVEQLWKSKAVGCKKLSLEPQPEMHKSIADTFTVPEEFLDAITWDIMAVPMTLPSGKVVDQGTLEKHGRNEATWGRQPSDPFTGICFVPSCQPILDVALKTRIDRFLVRHSDEKTLLDVPRTVGRMTASVDAAVSSLVRAAVKRSNGEVTAVNGGEIKTKSAKVETATTKSAIPRQSQQDVLDVNLKVVGSGMPVKLSRGVPVKTVEEVGSKRVLTERPQVTVKSHEDILDNSLRAAVKSCLSGLPSFTRFVSVQAPKCERCKADTCLFKLPCKHLLCRGCTLQASREERPICALCKASFKSGDPVRYHVQ